jgi:hypothetical protein
MFHLFQAYVVSVFYLDVANVSHISCKSMFEIFRLFRSYVAINVFMLQAASFLYGCCICCTHMLQVFVSNVLSASELCCNQVFLVASMFRELWGYGPGAR